jgi:ribosomal RNA-processing protein 17
MGFNRHNSAIVTKKQINRKNKLRVVFDENARKDFLTGFRKRKDERRKKAKEQIELNFKNEIKKIKSESRTKVR